MGDPIDDERKRARESDPSSSEEAVSGTGTGVVASSVKVTQTEPDANHASGDASMGSLPESHDRPTFKSSQLDGSEQENRER